MRRSVVVTIAVCMAVGLATGAWTRQDLCEAGETVESALAEAQQAVGQSSRPIQINTVGLDVEGDEEAISYLQSVAAIGGGSYYAAADASQVEAALAGAATGAASDFTGAPVIISPRNGDTVGPSTTVVGRAQPGQLVVVWTAVYDATTGELKKKVPGHRHLTDETGGFSLVISTPRIFLGADIPLRYEIHAQAFTGRTPSLEAIVTVVSPQ